MSYVPELIQPYLEKTRLRKVLVIATIITLILGLIPFAVQYAAVRTLQDMGARKAAIRDVDLNLFSGRLRVTNLNYQVAHQRPAQVDMIEADIDMLALLWSRIVIEHFALQGVDVEVTRSDDGSVFANGLTIVDASANSTSTEPAEPAGEPIEFALNQAALNNIHLAYRETDFNQQVIIERLNLSDLQSWKPQSSTHLSGRLTIDDAPLTLDTQIQPFAQPIIARGSIDLRELDATHYEKFSREHLQHLQAHLSLAADFDLSIGDQPSGNIESTIEISALDAQYRHISQRNDLIAWQGRVELKPDELPVVTGALTVANNRTHDNQQDYLIAGFNQLTIDGLDYRSPVSGFQSFKLTDFKLAQAKTQQLLGLEDLHISDMAFDQQANALRVKEIKLFGPQLQVTLNPQQNIDQLLPVLATVDRFSEITAQNDPAPATRTAQNGSAETPLQLDIRRISLAREGQIDFIEQSGDAQHESRIKLERIELQNISQQQPASIDLALNIDGAALIVDAEVQPFALPRTARGKVELKGLDLSHYRKFYQEHVQQLDGRFSLTSGFDLTLGSQVSGTLEPAIEITGLKTRYQQIDQQNARIFWQGALQLTEQGKAQVDGGLEIDDSLTRDHEQEYLVAGFDQLRIEGIRYSEPQAEILRTSLKGLKVAEIDEQNRLLNLDGLEMSELKFDQSGNSLQIGEIRLDAPGVRITIDEQKQLEQIKPLITTAQGFTESDDPVPANEPAAEGKPANKPMKLNIDRVGLQKPGKIDFVDRSVSPQYQTNLQLYKVDIENVSSERPASFDIAMQQGEYTLFDIKGNGLLMNPTEQIEVKATVKHLDLPPVTPYTSGTIGYGMKSGVVDSEISASIVKNQIDSTVDLIIDSVEVVETHQETAQEVTSASGMSIDLAISTLQDDNNIIELKLPIKGDISNPDFELNHVFNLALGKAMKSASMTYLTQALQPFGSLITLFNLINAAANHIALPPLVFAVNSVEFKTDDQQELIDKVLKLLKERPGLKLKACGVAALSDREAIHAQLLAEATAKLQQQESKEAAKKNATREKDSATDQPQPEVAARDINNAMQALADKRAARIKAYLLEKGELSPKRVLNCLSSTNLKEDSKPSVELQI